MSISMPEKKPRPVIRPLYVLLGLFLLGGIAAVYWHSSGRVSLVGEVKDSVVSLSPGMSGVFSRIEVREGQRVVRGQPLISLDASAQQRALAEERQKLAQFEALLPPQYVRAPGPGGRLQDEESLEERLTRQRGEEATAERRLQQAADREAQAAITYNRASMLASRGQMSARERDAAAAALDEARLEVQAAKAAFESFSLARSGTGAEIRRVKENQNAIGADTLPANLRIKNYELQRERVRAAAAALESTVVYAPEDGIVTEILARSGGPATAGAPCLYMALLDKSVIVMAQVSDDAAKKLRLKQQCRLEISGASDNPYEGYISNLLPKSNMPKDVETAAASGMRAQIAITGPAGKGRAEEEHSPTLYLLGGAKADIVVLLRAPLHGQEQETPARPAPEKNANAAPAATPAIAPSTAGSQGSSGTGQPTAARTNPQERGDGPDNPEGRLLPPVHPSAAHTQSPEASQGPLDANRSLPQLPPMQAPEKLTGSPLPDPQNNPSVVTQDILEREGNRER